MSKLSPEIKTKIADWFFGILGLLMTIIILYSFFLNYHENQLDTILTSSTGELYLTESKYFWGGVWFNNKDRLSISYDRFNIIKDSLLSGHKIVQLPFSKVNKVIFEEGVGIYEIKIESEGVFLNNSYNFYILNKDNFETVMDKIMEVGKGSLVIEVNKTLMNRFSNH